MKRTRGLVSLFLLIPVPAHLAAQTDVGSRVDSIAMAPITEGRIAGMSIAVVRGPDTLVLKAYGYADLEHHVPTPDDATYEIGSVTKQFTSVAVLQLVARGKIDLDADLTTYLPDYPTGGRRIPVRRLMDHTSGIKGYTEMPDFARLAPRKLPRDSLVAMFSAAPFDFEPGEALIYNNSAYFLLGLIIEAASGQSYEEYVQEHLFGPAGMPRSHYCSENAIVEGRAHGYDTRRDSLVLKAYLDHTWPYAAGSLCSTVRDLMSWNQALHGDGDGKGGPLLGADGYRELVTPGTLNDGTVVRYAKGLAVVDEGGRRRVSHGGGIFGFLSELRYYPDHDLSIAVLINTAGPVSPAEIASKIVELLLGPPVEPETRPFPSSLEEFTGRFRGPGRGRPLRVDVAVEDDHLTLAVQGGSPQALAWVEGLTFSAGNGMVTFVRQRGSGAIDTVKVDQVGGLYILERIER